MTELIRIDFKQKKVLGRHILGELAKPTKSIQHFTCICCRQRYNNDTDSDKYSPAVSWQVKFKKTEQTLHLCKGCIDGMHEVMNDMEE